MSATQRRTRDLSRVLDQARPVTSQCASKLPYASQLLAQNAGWLHAAAFPECGGVHDYPCGDHWHLGHDSREIGLACKAARPRPKLWRPARWSSGHRHPSARDRTVS